MLTKYSPYQTDIRRIIAVNAFVVILYYGRTVFNRVLKSSRMKFLKTISIESSVIRVDRLKSTKVSLLLKIFGICEAIEKQTRDYDEK